MGTLFIEMDADQAKEFVAENPGMEIVNGVVAEDAAVSTALDLRFEGGGGVVRMAPYRSEMTEDVERQMLEMGIGKVDLVRIPPAGWQPGDYLKLGTNVWTKAPSAK